MNHFRFAVARCAKGLKLHAAGADRAKVHPSKIEEVTLLEKGKRYKKGEYLFKEGDLTDRLFIIEKGRVSLTVERNGKKTEILSLAKTQILGEQSIFSNARQGFNAEATQECMIMEVPVDLIKSQFANSPPGVKLIMKSLVDEVKQGRQTLRSVKMSQDSSPCPQVSIPRVFCILNLVARHTGKVLELAADPATDGSSTEKIKKHKVDFGTIKLYTTRMFAESPQRIRCLVELLSKLKYLTMHFMKNEEGEEELDHVVIDDLQGIEDFAEFYQYNLYKGGKSEVIYLDPLAFKVAKAFVILSANVEVDRKGVVRLDYDEVLQKLKSDFKIELKATHLDALEKKGLFVQRVPQGDTKTEIRFDKAEFQKISKYWQVIREIDKWNEKGYIDMNDLDDAQEASATAGCPQCQGEVKAEHKFCPHCGFKLAA